MALGLNLYIVYSIRVLELLFGTGQYSSILLTNLIIYLSVKCALFYSNCYTTGSFFLTGALLSCYWSNNLDVYWYRNDPFERECYAPTPLFSYFFQALSACDIAWERYSIWEVEHHWVSSGSIVRLDKQSFSLQPSHSHPLSLLHYPLPICMSPSSFLLHTLVARRFQHTFHS